MKVWQWSNLVIVFLVISGLSSAQDLEVNQCLSKNAEGQLYFHSQEGCLSSEMWLLVDSDNGSVMMNITKMNNEKMPSGVEMKYKFGNCFVNLTTEADEDNNYFKVDPIDYKFESSNLQLYTNGIIIFKGNNSGEAKMEIDCSPFKGGAGKSIYLHFRQNLSAEVNIALNFNKNASVKIVQEPPVSPESSSTTIEERPKSTSSSTTKNNPTVASSQNTIEQHLGLIIGISVTTWLLFIGIISVIGYICLRKFKERKQRERDGEIEHFHTSRRVGEYKINVDSGTLVRQS